MRPKTGTLFGLSKLLTLHWIIQLLTNQTHNSEFWGRCYGHLTTCHHIGNHHTCGFNRKASLFYLRKSVQSSVYLFSKVMVCLFGTNLVKLEGMKTLELDTLDSDYKMISWKNVWWWLLLYRNTTDHRIVGHTHRSPHCCSGELRSLLVRCGWKEDSTTSWAVNTIWESKFYQITIWIKYILQPFLRIIPLDQPPHLQHSTVGQFHRNWTGGDGMWEGMY